MPIPTILGQGVFLIGFLLVAFARPGSQRRSAVQHRCSDHDAVAQEPCARTPLDRLPDSSSLGGWELRRALRLPRKSNPPLLEWLKSPVVYRHDPVFAAEFGALAAEFYSPRRCFAHYLHMAFGNWRDYLRGREEVSLKKYLYVFRPLLACRWIERQLGQVPMLFEQLVDGVLEEAEVREALGELVARKRAGEELAVAPPVEALTRFIEAELPRLEALNEPDDAAGEVEELNGFFRRYALAA